VDSGKISEAHTVLWGKKIKKIKIDVLHNVVKVKLLTSQNLNN
jgi:hypothetical protein